ncbi:hypothetical protein PspLS_11869 [Pyricularia sp. CBS 133598]|nr:hypothetical protein PspLS_11869 [Pyricularia sp. CBS 133598]
MSSFSIPSRPRSPPSDVSNNEFLILDEQDGLLSIGINFGTTLSGVAWATTDELQKGPNDINLIINWPGTGRKESKCPTELSYGDDGKIHCGFDVPPDASFYFSAKKIQMTTRIYLNTSSAHASSSRAPTKLLFTSSRIS